MGDMKLTLLDPPAALVSLDEAKRHLRVDHSDEDDIIQAYVRAAVGYLDGRDGILGRQLMPATWRLELGAWPARAIRLPLPPTIAVNGITYLDENGDEQTVATSVYRVSGLNTDSGAVISQQISQTWPTVLAEDWP